MATTRPHTLKVASLNLKAFFYAPRDGIGELPDLLARQKPDVILLQECRRPWFDSICDVTETTGIHSRDAEPDMDDWPPDGCAIAVRKPLELRHAWRLPRESFQPAVVAQTIDEPTPADHEIMPYNLTCRCSARTLFAEVVADGFSFFAASLHAPPGSARVSKTQRVHEWKPFFHGNAAIALARLEGPFIFAIDANEPFAETPDSITFHWEAGRPGVLKFEALLGLKPIHRGRDLLRESMVRDAIEPESDTCLARTYATSGDDPRGHRRFDHMHASPEFTVRRVTTQYEAAISAGTDHALTVAELELEGPDGRGGR